MNKTYGFYKYFIIVMCFALLTNCSSNSKQNKIEHALESETLAFEKDLELPSNNYKIPTPLELFLFLQDSESDYMHDALHSPLAYKNYYNSYSRAINFGIYTADLAYATIYGNNQDALLYFKAAKELATALGLNEGYGSDMVARIDDNLENMDSLINIAADSYDYSILYLEEQGQAELLCLILTGGWIESLYLSCESVPAYDVNNPVMERIADQQLLLDNLLIYFKKHEDTKNVAITIATLEELQEEFDLLYSNDDSVVLSKSQLVTISNKVSEIRSDFISFN